MVADSTVLLLQFYFKVQYKNMSNSSGVDALQVFMSAEVGEREPALLLTIEEDVALEDNNDGLEGKESEEFRESDSSNKEEEVFEEEEPEEDERIAKLQVLYSGAAKFH
ncbi:hypothetical protein K435DRAFT_891969 [Dendrothele bispora CBS 962.96]|uniref:Uncharacterized protein n=1 Tax=Dendrothele bispora (strain CBS 962.96) TaxID=1314807 RepID=A0A4S8KP70_DENBC|nr:hypothetical protein K435DRAFT_891969 [Dendrothele bispora CBS 962.96]